MLGGRVDGDDLEQVRQIKDSRGRILLQKLESRHKDPG